MVKLVRAAVRLVVDTRTVELEGRVGGINSNRDWLNSNSFLEGGFVSRVNIGVGRDGGSSVSGGVLARVAVSGGVRVRSFSVNSLVVNDVGEGIVHQTSSTSVVSLGGGAVDEVLLGEGDQASGLEEPSSFDRASGGERPARAALALVLDWGDGSFGSPVNTVWEGNVLGGKLSSLSGRVGLSSEVSGFEFSVCQVGKVVDSQCERVAFGVVSVDVVEVGLEDSVSVALFVVGDILLGVFFNKAAELNGIVSFLKVNFHCAADDSQEGDGENDSHD